MLSFLFTKRYRVLDIVRQIIKLITLLPKVWTILIIFITRLKRRIISWRVFQFSPTWIILLKILRSSFRCKLHSLSSAILCRLWHLFFVWIRLSKIIGEWVVFLHLFFLFFPLLTLFLFSLQLEFFHARCIGGNVIILHLLLKFLSSGHAFISTM